MKGYVSLEDIFFLLFRCLSWGCESWLVCFLSLFSSKIWFWVKKHDTLVTWNMYCSLISSYFVFFYFFIKLMSRVTKFSSGVLSTFLW